MLKKMQQKFIAVVMLAYFILFAIVIGSINLFSAIQMYQKYDKILEILEENDGEFPEMQEYEVMSSHEFGNEFSITVETPYENRYFSVNLEKDGTYRFSNLKHVAAISEADARLYAKRIFRKLDSGDVKRGNIGVYRYRLLCEENGYVAYFVDVSQQIYNMNNIRDISVAIGIILMFLLWMIVRKLSVRAIAPMVENMEKQKRFITDAGHELKTPLAVISANADVLELMQGKNEWIDSIRNQTMELDELIKRLLFLAKMEEEQRIVMSEFDLSETVKNKTGQIKAIADSKGKVFQTDIQENIRYKGDVDAIEHLISVLTENAVKYCSENGVIEVKLFKSGRIIHFQVRNTGEAIDESQMGHLFERFYRTDASRNRDTGGHGIGLSIAKAVVQSHKGRIYAKNEEGKIAFCVEFKV